MALIVKHFEKKCTTCPTTRALQGKAPAHDNHWLLLHHDNRSLQYDYHTIDIIAHHYSPQILCNFFKYTGMSTFPDFCRYLYQTGEYLCSKN